MLVNENSVKSGSQVFLVLASKGITKEGARKTMVFNMLPKAPG